MTKYRSPDQVAVTSTSQTVELYESHINHTLRNVGTTDIYWHSDVDITAASLLTKTAAQLRTAGCSLLKAGECNTIETRNVMLTVVCANGVTGTLDIEPGAISSPVTVDANIGNVGILNAAETEIDPAKNESEGQTIVYADLPSNATTAATAEQVIAAVASEKFYVLEVSLTFTTQDTVRLLESTRRPFIGVAGMWPPAEGYTCPVTPPTSHTS